ncbi:patatin family protein [uncultured Thomasclavelia sp.]|uniref:patatin-like phospholipase family protein n=1 Tax=uncultured Thomasclavelia sp. TaxID=3025759 RepID=UPI0025DDCE70|nr:patatin family protein [uncultured Thomasclavelia sp.]
MKVGLVLEGGAMRGLYTAGVLDVFLDQQINIDGIIGVSAGALFGVNYVSKQKGRTLRYNKKYVGDKRYMGLHSLITTGNIVNKDFAYYQVPLKLDPFDQETFAKSNIEFLATVTNLKTGQPEYIKIINAYKQMEVFRATSAMPFVSKIVTINDQEYLDGGIADSIPIEKAKQLGYDKIIVILTRPIEYRKKKSNQLIPKLFYHRYPNFVQTINNRYLNYNKTVEKIIELEQEHKIFVIRPSKTVPIKRLEKDPDRLQEIYDLGVIDANKIINDLKQYLTDS